MPVDTTEHKDTRDVAETSAETEHPTSRLSEKGVRAMQGEAVKEDASVERDTMKGSDFEHWAETNVFAGEGRRMTVRPEDNPHLDRQSDDGLGLTKRRQSDAFIDSHGELYELKAGYEKGGIDHGQAYEYSLMQDAGKVYERDEDGLKQKEPTEITGVSYIFDGKTGAEANRRELEQYSFGILYRDEHGQLQQLKDK